MVSMWTEIRFQALGPKSKSAPAVVDSAPTSNFKCNLFLWHRKPIFGFGRRNDNGGRRFDMLIRWCQGGVQREQIPKYAPHHLFGPSVTYFRLNRFQPGWVRWMRQGKGFPMMCRSFRYGNFLARNSKISKNIQIRIFMALQKTLPNKHI